MLVHKKGHNENVPCQKSVLITAKHECHVIILIDVVHPVFLLPFFFFLLCFFRVNHCSRREAPTEF